MFAYPELMSANFHRKRDAAVVYSVYKDFGHYVDPAIIYTPEGAAQRGLTIEDAEEEVLGIRGWTSCLPSDIRFHILRRSVPMPEVDDVLLKYLGHDRFGVVRNGGAAVDSPSG